MAAETPETPQDQNEQQDLQQPQENHPQESGGQQADGWQADGWQPQGIFWQQPSQQMPYPPYEPEEARQLKTAQTLMAIAGIGGPVSIFFGGTLLSTVASVCGILAVVKYQKLIKKGGSAAALAQRMRIAAAGACGVSCLALVMNVISLIMVWSMLMEIIESGDISSILQGSESASSGTGNSIWG